MAHQSDAEYIEKTHNIPRFFAENRQIGVVLLIGTILWGLYGYERMPKRKDPNIPVRVAVATCRWPGVDAEQVEQLVTRQMEQAMAESSRIHAPSASDYGIKSLTLPGLAIVYVQLSENVSDTTKEFNDINLRLQAINDQLPQGAGPVNFQSDFGDTAALMLTVASPPADEIEIAARAAGVRRAIDAARASRSSPHAGSLLTIIYCFPNLVPLDLVQRPFQMFTRAAIERGLLSEARQVSGPGFTGVDAFSSASDAEILAFGMRFVRERLHESEIHPDAWQPVVIRDPQETRAKLAAVAGEKYSYRELDDFTDLIQRTLHEAPEVSKVDRSGVLPEWVYLNYSQEQLAGYGLQPSDLQSVLQARNISLPGGQLEVGRKNILISPSGEFESPQAIGEVIVGTSSFSGSPVYLRDLVDIARGYQSPARFLNFYQWRDREGKWHRSRAVTVAVQMRAGQQIGQFSESVEARLASVRQLLPRDLIIARTSDQSAQTEENVKLFMDSLYEAIALVVLVSLIGFWEWRSSLLMALSIPTTLFLTFGFAFLLGIDIQQVSIASLIIALGLLVDDPVVAGDAIKRSLAAGHPRLVAVWLGPTKLTRAITYATITNIAAYLPFLLLTGNTGDFLYSLPIVLTCSLVASRIVSMTFIPLLAYYILRPSKKPEITLEESRNRGFTGFYYRVAGLAIEHRWKVFAGSLVFLAIGVLVSRSLKTSFFPDDVQPLSYMNVWLPNDAPLIITDETAQQVEGVIRETAARYGQKHPGSDGKPRQILHSITTFVGGGGPRFWFSVSPELQQLNYAQVIIEVMDKNDTLELVKEWQTAVSTQVPGALVDVRQCRPIRWISLWRFDSPGRRISVRRRRLETSLRCGVFPSAPRPSSARTRRPSASGTIGVKTASRSN